MTEDEPYCEDGHSMCYCPCHEDESGETKHCVPCCWTCPTCGMACVLDPTEKPPKDPVCNCCHGVHCDLHDPPSSSRNPMMSWRRVFDFIKEPNRSRCLKLYEENYEIIQKARGSKSKHQAWTGGYIDHVTECVGIAKKLYKKLNKMRTLNFMLSDAALVLFFHDLEKPWKHQADIVGGKIVSDKLIDNPMYGRASTNSPKMHPKTLHCLKMAADYGIEFTEQQKNAIIYCEGEGGDYNPHERVMNELAAFCHCCDTISARIWHNFP